MATQNVEALPPVLLDAKCAQAENFEEFVEALKGWPEAKNAWEEGRSEEMGTVEEGAFGPGRGQGRRQKLLELFQTPA